MECLLQIDVHAAEGVDQVGEAQHVDHHVVVDGYASISWAVSWMARARITPVRGDLGIS